MKVITLFAGLSLSMVWMDSIRAASLTTNFLADRTGDEGYQFDIEASKALVITGIQIAFEQVPVGDFVELFTKSGTHVGSETNEADWDANGVAFLTVSALNTPSPIIPFTKPLVLVAGDRAAIYVVRNRGAGENVCVSETGGATTAAADGNLTIFSGIEIGDFFGIANGPAVPNIILHYELDAAPRVSVFGSKRIVTSERRHRVTGIVLDDVSVERVRVRFKRLRGNGSQRTVTRFLSPGPDGVFSKSIKTFEGRNVVRINAFDTAGNGSQTAKVVIVGTP